MKQELVSIIVPVYNCEEYIEECIRSIVKQTYDNIEILIIDDGSTDGTVNICNRYAEEDIRIKMYLKENAGVSSARNTGICLAKGIYLCFVDSDDYLENTYVEQLVKGLQYADLSICGYSRVCNKEVTRFYLDKEKGNIAKEDVIKFSLCSPKIAASCWNKMFKNKIINDNKLMFRTDITIGEDMLFFLQYLEKCNTFIYLPEALYNYRKNKASVIQSGYTNAKFDERKCSVLIVLKKIEEMSHHLKNDLVKCCFAYRRVRSSIWLMLQMVYGNYKDDKVLREIQKNCIQGLKTWKFFQEIGSVSERLIAVSISVMPHLSYAVMKVIIKKFPKVVQKFLA